MQRLAKRPARAVHQSLLVMDYSKLEERVMAQMAAREDPFMEFYKVYPHEWSDSLWSEAYQTFAYRAGDYKGWRVQ